ncbi:MAG: Phage tail assembly chaperone protein [Pseudomonadota bacterium]|jgi:hypothetical protein
MSALPWPDLLRFAQHIGVTPQQFWALSIAEWRALVGPAQGLSPNRLAELCQAFPDQEDVPDAENT